MNNCNYTIIHIVIKILYFFVIINHFYDFDYFSYSFVLTRISANVATVNNTIALPSQCNLLYIK